MGDLISMADFKRQAVMKARFEKEEIITRINQLMAESYELRLQLAFDTTTTEEQVYESLQKISESVRLAKSIGCEIATGQSTTKGWALVDIKET